MSKSEEILASLSKNIPAKVIEENQRMQIATAEHQQPPAIVDSSNEDLEDDYKYSREVYRKLVDKGQIAIDSMMDLASQSDHPRAYEVLGGMLKNVSDMTDKLVSLHKNLDSVKNKREESSPGSTSVNQKITNNNVFVGSTTDLQRMLIAQQREGKIIDADDR
jgi:hypothetical protein